MPTYTVQCADRNTGETSHRPYTAPSAQHAATLAARDGFVVGRVDLATTPDSSPHAPTRSATAEPDGDGSRVMSIIPGTSARLRGTITLGVLHALAIAFFAFAAYNRVALVRMEVPSPGPLLNLHFSQIRAADDMLYFAGGLLAVLWLLEFLAWALDPSRR